MKAKFNSAFKVAIIYFFFSTLWIFVSDSFLLFLYKDIDKFRSYSTIKGTIFVLASASIIYLLVDREIKQLKDTTSSLKHYQTYDTLTGLYNRETFFTELERIHKSKEIVSIIYTDINGLKLFNEVFDSSKGDRLLQRYANILKDYFLNSFSARVGGDEFVTIIKECDYKMVERYSKSLLNFIEKEKMGDFDITVSIGYSAVIKNKVNVYQAFALAEDRMLKNKLLTDSSASSSVITSLKTTMFERSDETEMHASRMSELCDILGKKLGLPITELNDLKLLAILHDIGKIGIPDSILRKPGKLTDIEFNKMKRHPLIGYQMASSITPLKGIAYYILTHHEKVDGTGYPNGLKGDNIPLLSRILSIVDAYDAMTNDRIYRKALTKETAIEEIIRNKGTQFDSDIVDVFLQTI